MPKFVQKRDRRRVGRPSVAQSQKRTTPVRVYLTASEAQDLSLSAYQAGMSVSYLVRTRVFATSSR